MASSRLQSLLQTHNSERGGGDFLIHDKHEGGCENRLQQLGLQAFVQTQNAVFPAIWGQVFLIRCQNIESR